jgi:Fur family ferric uptake transcriptional regulator
MAPVPERVALLCDALRARGERLTPARRRVLEVLAASAEHVTADDVLDQVQRTNPEVHRATVYRTLDTLTRLGITEHTHLGHGPAVYHLVDDLHQHLVCEACGRVIEAPATLFRGVERRLRDDYGFTMRPLHFAIVGRCRRCVRGS